ncbi:CAP domain-containing protein [Archaeoglobus fulgidus]|uniref:SCP domain-containing protein n=2 Tax=Archaeoglobus fulgidus TaxID=2234 RepID=O30232_ARCFU|nr:CAP domain-containing protein [Archaeoglobus fulgidus]AAB91238.1 predicted coding region AF_0003 [Archaeoglobus fulgidus DSM 4304]AIG96847.1 Uncharacterized protein with SCP/PR1 domain protein [Archaeoglobus fulgidus DSM 8774]
MKETIQLAIGVMLLAMLGCYIYITEFYHYESTEESSKAAIEYLNQLRAQNGLPPVKWNKTLYEFALERLEDMHERGYYSHYDPVTHETLIYRYVEGYVGECILNGVRGTNLLSNGLQSLFGYEEEAIDIWSKSTMHKLILTDKRFTDAAVACKYDMCVLIMTGG